MNKESIIVFTGDMARKLLKMGYQIIDIKPNRDDPSGKSSVFVFKNENNLSGCIYELTH